MKVSVIAASIFLIVVVGVLVSCSEVLPVYSVSAQCSEDSTVRVVSMGKPRLHQAYVLGARNMPTQIECAHENVVLILRSDSEEYWPNLEIRAFDPVNSDQIVVKGAYRGRNLGYIDGSVPPVPKLSSIGTDLLLVWDKRSLLSWNDMSGYQGEVIVDGVDRQFRSRLGIELQRNGVSVWLLSL